MSESESLIILLLPLVDVTSPGIFRLSGNSTRQLRLLDTVKNGQDAKSLEINSHDVATVVKQVLREYPGRLFDSTTESYLSRLVKDDSETTFHRMQDILRQLSADRISLLNVILPFLHKVAMLSDVNKMDASNLARVIALDFFPDISNPLGTDSTLVRQIIDWRIKVVEKLIAFGDRIIDDNVISPATPVASGLSGASVTPVQSRCGSTISGLPGDASQKRKRPPQSPLKSVWHGLTNIFSKTPRPGRPESTPPNGTPSFFTKFSSRLIASGKKVKHEEDETGTILTGYRSDDNSTRCPPVKQNLRVKFSHKKKSPKVSTPGRHKTPSTPIYHGINYGTFTKNPFPTAPEEQVRTELFHFTAADSDALESGSKHVDLNTSDAPFVFSSQQNLSQHHSNSLPLPASSTVKINSSGRANSSSRLSPVNISPDLRRFNEDVVVEEEDSTDSAPNRLVSSTVTGECSNSNEMCDDEAVEMCEADAVEMGVEAMETMEMEDLDTENPPVVNIDPPPSVIEVEKQRSPSINAEEMRDSLCDLLNISSAPRCRQGVVESKPVMLSEPVVETTFDDKDEAQKRLISQVRRQLGPTANSSNTGTSRRPSVANLERSAMVSQGRRLWEQGGPCNSSMSNYSSAFNLAIQNATPGDLEAQLQSNSFPRAHHVSSSKRQTDL